MKAKICNKCKREFVEDEKVYNINVIQNYFPQLDGGPYEEEIYLCEECYEFGIKNIFDEL